MERPIFCGQTSRAISNFRFPISNCEGEDVTTCLVSKSEIGNWKSEIGNRKSEILQRYWSLLTPANPHARLRDMAPGGWQEGRGACSASVIRGILEFRACQVNRRRSKSKEICVAWRIEAAMRSSNSTWLVVRRQAVVETAVGGTMSS
jgi:hypothetical protein